MLEFHVMISRSTPGGRALLTGLAGKSGGLRFLFLFGSASITWPRKPGKLRRHASWRGGIGLWSGLLALRFRGAARAEMLSRDVSAGRRKMPSPACLPKAQSSEQNAADSRQRLIPLY